MDFDKTKYKIYTWKNWLVLHWILNPGLAINEILLGQRIPKLTLVDKTSNKPRLESTFVPCPHCNTLHDSRTWSAKNNTAFKNWFGLYCTNCNNSIPCVQNVFSVLILILTFPVWGWFKNQLKEKWLQKQPERYKHITIETLPQKIKRKDWLKMGLFWGLFMYVIMSVCYPLIIGQAVTLKTLLLGVIIWALGGLAFGYSMKLILNKALKIN